MAAQQQVVRVKVPQGATTGSTVQATLPNGQQVKVQLPAGVVPGQVVSIAVQPSPRTTQTLPPTPARNLQEVEMKAVRLTVPATIPASGTIRFTLDGAVREIPLPPGARPGQTLDLQVPAAPPTPVKKKSSSWFGSKKTAAEKQQIKQQKAAEKERAAAAKAAKKKKKPEAAPPNADGKEWGRKADGNMGWVTPKAGDANNEGAQAVTPVSPVVPMRGLRKQFLV